MFLHDLLLKLYTDKLRGGPAQSTLAHALLSLSSPFAAALGLPPRFGRLEGLFISESFRSTGCCVGVVETILRTPGRYLYSGWLICLSKELQSLRIFGPERTHSDALIGLSRSDLRELLPLEADVARCGFCGAFDCAPDLSSLALNFEAACSDQSRILGRFEVVPVLQSHPFYELEQKLQESGLGS